MDSISSTGGRVDVESFLVCRGRRLLSQRRRIHLVIPRTEQLADATTSRDMHEVKLNVERTRPSLNTTLAGQNERAEARRMPISKSLHLLRRQNNFLKLVWGFAGK